jgi:hypothetical protein
MPPDHAAALPPAPRAEAHLRAATRDLARLEQLLDDASRSLLAEFGAAQRELERLPPDHAVRQRVLPPLGRAITALQFHDLASQLIAHASLQLEQCAAQWSPSCAGAVEPPTRENPVAQSGMAAGSVELF